MLSLMQFYMYYLNFLERVYKKNKSLEAGWILIFQQLVTKEYYYPESAASSKLTLREVSNFADKIIAKAVSYRQLGDRREYPYFVINAPDSIDREKALELHRPLLAFKGMPLANGDVNSSNRTYIKERIKNAGSVELLPLDFHQRLSNVGNISTMVINVKKGKITNIIDFISNLYNDPEFSHRILKVSIAGPKFYDVSSEKVAVYFSADGIGFNNRVVEWVINRLD